MKVLVTGSAGHLGEALMRVLPGCGHEAVGVDIRPSSFTHHIGSIADPDFVRGCAEGVEAILHAATLHKPHVATHTKHDFVQANVAGTLVLLEAAVERGIERFVFTSTTSAFGASLSPGPGQPAAWIDEAVASVPKNIYGVTKTAAEDLCQLFARKHGLNCVVLRTSRFFPEEDDSAEMRTAYSGENAKANEFLFRRVDLEDAAAAHVRALERAPEIGFGKYVISAPSPFQRNDLVALRTDAVSVVGGIYPEFARIYQAAGFAMFPDIERVYASDLAQKEIGWAPTYDFGKVLAQIAAGEPVGSDLSRAVGIKGYHAEAFAEGPYPVE